MLGEGRKLRFGEYERGGEADLFLTLPLTRVLAPEQGYGWWPAWSLVCYLSHPDSRLLQSGTAGKQNKLLQHILGGNFKNLGFSCWQLRMHRVKLPQSSFPYPSTHLPCLLVHPL